ACYGVLPTNASTCAFSSVLFGSTCRSRNHRAFSPLDRCDEPTGSSAATCPSLARWTTIFECDFSPSHRAYTCPTQAIRFVASRFRSLVLNYYHVGKIARRQRSRYRSGRPVGALTIVGAGDDRSSTPTIATLPLLY